MKTTAFFNLKGGVAKTTSVINTAAILARDCGKNVLVIDADSQCNTTEFFGGKPEGVASLSSLLRKIAGPESDCFEDSNFPGVSLLPADDSLMDLDLSKIENGQLDMNCLRDLVNLLESVQQFDHILIDCPPAFNAATVAALLASDEVVIPIKMDAFSIRGMANLMRQIDSMQKINRKLKVAGLLPTMYYKCKTLDETEAMLRTSGLKVFHHIRRSPAVDVMTYRQQPLIICSKTSGACKDYQAFAAELTGGVQNV